MGSIHHQGNTHHQDNMMHMGKFHSHLHTLVIHFRLNSDIYQNILYYILMYNSDINLMVGGNTFRPTAFLFVYINVKEHVWQS